MSKRPLFTLFTCPKPFVGRSAVIQSNAFRSYRTLIREGEGELLLVGREPGYEEAAREAGARHLPVVVRNARGTPLVSDLFAIAEREGRGEWLVYINADILLFPDFPAALKRLPGGRVLGIGQRWDLRVDEELDVGIVHQRERLFGHLRRHGTRHGPTGMDYFVFRKGLWGELPPFAVGRTSWDNWLVERAQECGARLIDCSDAFLAVHQDHDYDSLPGGRQEIWFGSEAMENRRLAGYQVHDIVGDVRDCRWCLDAEGRLRPVLDAMHLRWRVDTRRARYYPRLDAGLNAVLDVARAAKRRLKNLFKG